mmetsp:Transcript_45503/g.75586  ORF Transcript_45503/g.75586 Transcript_45503/m.75586 type:complete len:256 (-) Transcript_45503:1217-1984(-)
MLQQLIHTAGNKRFRAHVQHNARSSRRQLECVIVAMLEFTLRIAHIIRVTTTLQQKIVVTLAKLVVVQLYIRLLANLGETRHIQSIAIDHIVHAFGFRRTRCHLRLLDTLLRFSATTTTSSLLHFLLLLFRIVVERQSFQIVRNAFHGKRELVFGNSLADSSKLKLVLENKFHSMIRIQLSTHDSIRVCLANHIHLFRVELHMFTRRKQRIPHSFLATAFLASSALNNSVSEMLINALVGVRYLCWFRAIRINAH